MIFIPLDFEASLNFDFKYSLFDIIEMAVIPPRHTFAITISTCPARMSVFGGEQATNYSDMMEGPIMQARDFIRSKKLVNTTIFVGQCRLDPAFNPPEEYAQHFLSSADADSKKVAGKNDLKFVRVCLCYNNSLCLFLFFPVNNPKKISEISTFHLLNFY